MKIINLSYSDQFGGAARSAYNIHRSLTKNKINSKMVVIKKISKDKDVIILNDPFYIFILKLKNYFTYMFSKFFFNGNASFNFFSNKNLVKKINLLNPDIVLIHWVHAEMLSIEDIKKIKAPKILIMHDMWWLKGCKHYFNENFKRRKLYKYNKLLDNFNLQILTDKRKKKLELNNIITPSNWLNSCVKKFINNKNVYNKVIKYPVNIDVFKPLKVNRNKKIQLLFVGFGKIDQRRKGIDLLFKILNRINSKNFELTIVGDINQEILGEFNFKIKYIKKVNSDFELNRLYNKSDILIFTSRQDNLPNVVLEAMAAGLPIVSFNIGGIKDVISNNNNGFICDAFRIDLFAKRVDRLISNKNLRIKFKRNSRSFAINNLNYKKIGKEYISYFRRGINNGY
tara:strand:+ start:1302 stop:2495 length:1194 start_codon:yes stop_codon:yes gene_type:complete